MQTEFDKKIERIPVIGTIVHFLKRVYLSKKSDLSLYDFFKLYLNGLVQGMFASRSGGIAFSFFMAIFPFLLFILNLVPFIPIDNFQNDVLEFMSKILPPETSSLFNSIFEDIAKNRRGGLLSSVGFLSIILVANGINSILGGFEYSYHTTIKRSIVRQYLIAFLIAVALAIALVFFAAFFVTVEVYVYPNIDVFLSYVPFGDNLIVIFNYTFSLFTLFVFVSVLYYFGTAEGKQVSFFSIGSFFTVFLIIITTYLFSIYINNFSRYNEIYGSIGTLLIFMLYIWINSNILLLGFEINASITTVKRTLKSQNESIEK